MGLGLYIISELPKKGIFKKAIPEKEIFILIATELKKSLPPVFQNKYFSTTQDNKTLSVFLHPSEESVRFEIDNNTLTCSAKTNSAGPGYHAYLVETLETIGKKLNLQWIWKNADGDIGDETSYFETRDFSKLQDEMLVWLKQVAEYFNSLTDYTKLMLSMPLNYHVEGDYFAISSLGYWNKEWFERINKKNITDLYDDGLAFFPWWNKGFDSEFFLKSALVTAWVDLDWRTAFSDEDQMKCEFVLDCFSEAKSLNPDIALPLKEIEEIRQNLDKSLYPSVPKPEGIGFKRRIMKQNLTGKWTGLIPGYFYCDMENEQSTIVYWFNDRTIRGSSYEISGKNGKVISVDEILNDQPTREGLIYFDDGTQKGWAEITKNQENVEEYWMLSGRMAIPGHLSFLTICYNNENDKEWAIETWKTVRMSMPSE